MTLASFVACGAAVLGDLKPQLVAQVTQASLLQISPQTVDKSVHAFSTHAQGWHTQPASHTVTHTHVHCFITASSPTLCINIKTHAILCVTLKPYTPEGTVRPCAAGQTPAGSLRGGQRYSSWRETRAHHTCRYVEHTGGGGEGGLRVGGQTEEATNKQTTGIGRDVHQGMPSLSFLPPDAASQPTQTVFTHHTHTHPPTHTSDHSCTVR